MADSIILLEERKEMLEKVGIHLEVFSEHGYILRELPLWMKKIDENVSFTGETNLGGHIFNVGGVELVSIHIILSEGSTGVISEMYISDILIIVILAVVTSSRLPSIIA